MALDDLKSKYAELFEHIAVGTNLTEDKYVALPDEIRGKMPESFEEFVGVAAKMGIQVDADLGMTSDQYVQMNTKTFESLSSEELEEQVPEVLAVIEEMLDGMPKAELCPDGSESTSELRSRLRGEAAEQAEMKKEVNKMGGHKLDNPTELRIALALVAMWLVIFYGAYKIYYWRS
mmetsp:Transcript_144264/g.262380  ORF Transcript_144264/g.262380 Transcript_144264/m.262380 type:complete len:176 (-) Transcript_144264:122-649(-)